MMSARCRANSALVKGTMPQLGCKKRKKKEQCGGRESNRGTPAGPSRGAGLAELAVLVLRVTKRANSRAAGRQHAPLLPRRQPYRGVPIRACAASQLQNHVDIYCFMYQERCASEMQVKAASTFSTVGLTKTQEASQGTIGMVVRVSLAPASRGRKENVSRVRWPQHQRDMLLLRHTLKGFSASEAMSWVLF